MFVSSNDFAGPNPDFVAFWTAFCRGKAVLEDNKFLRLPDGVYLLGKKDLGSVLMVRDCYVHLFNIVSGLSGGAFDKQKTLWIVIGNPGIGKTLFSVHHVAPCS
jgi:hypothetical protein